MTRATTESRQGWTASVLFHAAVIIALFFLRLRMEVNVPEFVEMAWGGASSAAGAMGVSPRTLEASARRTAVRADEDNVALPKRSASDFPEDAINVPSTKRTVTPDAAPNFSSSKKLSGDDRPFVPSSAAGGREPTITGTGSGIGSGVSAPTSGMGGSGDGISFGISWGAGGTRRLESGALPAYPPGVNSSAQIKLKLVVLPGGTVKSAQPMQKGETRLENAALKAVRQWKFDALQSGQPAVDQACIVTFNFRLK